MARRLWRLKCASTWREVQGECLSHAGLSSRVSTLTNVLVHIFLPSKHGLPLLSSRPGNNCAFLTPTTKLSKVARQGVATHRFPTECVVFKLCQNDQGFCLSASRPPSCFFHKQRKRSVKLVLFFSASKMRLGVEHHVQTGELRAKHCYSNKLCTKRLAANERTTQGTSIPKCFSSILRRWHLDLQNLPF